LAATREGVNLAIVLSLKALAITLGAMAVTGKGKVFELLAGARKLGAPEKLAAIFLMMMRYISVIGQQYHRLRNAMRIRGFQAGTNFQTLRTYANLAGLLLVRGIDRAERVHWAMLCRGYNGHFYIKTDFKFKFLDLGAAFLVLALGLAAAGLDVHYTLN
jgi:cobalt/nickel transport system permease protein